MRNYVQGLYDTMKEFDTNVLEMIKFSPTDRGLTFLEEISEQTSQSIMKILNAIWDNEFWVDIAYRHPATHCEPEHERIRREALPEAQRQLEDDMRERAWSRLVSLTERR